MLSGRGTNGNDVQSRQASTANGDYHMEPESKKLEGDGVSETRSSKWNGWKRGTRLHRSGEAFILGGQPSYQQQGSCRPVLRGGVRPHLLCPTQTFPVALPVHAGLQCQYSNPHIELSEGPCAECGTMHIPNWTNMQIPLTIPLAGG